MNNFKYILSIVCCVLLVSACDSMDFGDVNEDDDSVTQADTKSLMAGAMNRFFTLTGRNYAAKPTLYVQYQSQVQYTAEQRYNTAPVSWSAYYVQTLSNLKNVVEVNSADEVDALTRSYGAPVNQIGVAELMSSFIWKQATDTYGPIPYRQALSDSTITPAYTPQDEIYNDLFSRVKAARDMLDASLDGPTGDVVYGGDVTKWKKFANSFLMSLAMQISGADASKAEQEFTAALNHPDGYIDEISEEFWYQYQNLPGAENPFSQFRGADYQMSLPFTSALSGESDGSFIDYSSDTYDDRLQLLASEPELDGRPYGRDELDDSNTPAGLTGTFTSLSTAVIGPAAPLPYMTASYTLLNRAEAAQRGWTSESATDLFTQGVMMSYATMDAHWDDGSASSGMLTSDGSDYAASRLDDADMMQVIGEEKWVSLIPMGFQSWSEFRRTGFPILTPAINAVNNGEIPKRYVYPQSEDGTNREAYTNGVNLLNPAEDTNTALFWWNSF